MKFGVLHRATNKVVSWYISDRIAYKSPFADQIVYFHFKIVEQYPEGYSLDNLGNLSYDFNYTPMLATYSKAKETMLDKVQEQFNELSITFAVSNSEMLSNEITRLAGLGQIDPTDAVALATFVRSKLDPLVNALKPLVDDVRSHYFWRIEEHIALIPREDLLANNERLAQFEANLISIVRP